MLFLKICIKNNNYWFVKYSKRKKTFVALKRGTRVNVTRYFHPWFPVSILLCMNNDVSRVGFHWRRSPVSDTSGIASLPLMSNFQ